VADWRRFLPKGAATTRGDVGAAGLGYAIGFAVDVFLFPLGVPPGTTAGVFAVGAVGLKNAVQAGLEQRSSAKRDTPEALAERHEALLTLLQEAGEENLIGELERANRLWKKGIDSDDEFRRSMADLIIKYKTGRKPTKHRAG
jgi:hypothetical protein